MCAWILKQLQSTCLFTSYPHNSPLVAPDVELGQLLFCIHTALLWAQLSKISTMTFPFLASVFITLVFTQLYRKGIHKCTTVIGLLLVFKMYWYRPILDTNISQIIGYKLDINSYTNNLVTPLLLILKIVPKFNWKALKTIGFSF